MNVLIGSHKTNHLAPLGERQKMNSPEGECYGETGNRTQNLLHSTVRLDAQC
jgi:hypothetical protein